MLTPVFSIAYLRGLTSVFYETTHKVSAWALALPYVSTNLEANARVFVPL